LVASAGAAVKTLLSLEAARSDFDMRHVLAVDVPVMHLGKKPGQEVEYYQEAARRIRELPGVQNVSVGTTVPWRDTGSDFGLQFSADGHVPAPGEERRRAKTRVISPGFFATLGLPIVEGRDFNDADRAGSAPVAIVSETLVHRIFPGRNPLNHYVMWTDPILKVIPGMISTEPLRIIGVVADLDDMNVVPRPTMTVYRPFDQEQVLGGGRLFVHVSSDPYALVPPITQILRKMSADQPVERAATLEDVRAQVLSPERLNAVVFGAFAAVALMIAVVGVVGVLAFSVSGRTREFGIRLAVGSQPHRLLARVVAEGAAMATGGLAVGFASGFALAQLAGALLGGLKMPGLLPVVSSAAILLLAAITASVIPAARAARVDVIQALRSE
jgi:predicted permease